MSPPPAPSSSTRWCPTPEQLMILEELYRRGLKTPNSSQIQRITAHLSLYGKIQGKNVFYWFQNHKARDRQKLRKKLIANQLLHHTNYQLHPHLHYPFPNYFSTPNLIFPQGSEIREEVMKVQRELDVGKDGYDSNSMMIIEAGPTFPCCTRNPPQTLQLFPLSPL